MKGIKSLFFNTKYTVTNILFILLVIFISQSVTNAQQPKSKTLSMDDFSQPSTNKPSLEPDNPNEPKLGKVIFDKKIKRSDSKNETTILGTMVVDKTILEVEKGRGDLIGTFYTLTANDGSLTRRFFSSAVNRKTGDVEDKMRAVIDALGTAINNVGTGASREIRQEDDFVRIDTSSNDKLIIFSIGNVSKDKPLSFINFTIDRATARDLYKLLTQ